MVKRAAPAVDPNSVSEGPWDQPRRKQFSREAEGGVADPAATPITAAIEVAEPEAGEARVAGSQYTGPVWRRFRRGRSSARDTRPPLEIRGPSSVRFGVATGVRVAAHVAGLMLLFAALAGAAFIVALAQPDGILSSTGLAIGAFAVPAAYFWVRLAINSRQALRGGSLAIVDGRLEIEHPALFEGRLHIPLEMVRAASIDDRPDPDIDRGISMRFPAYQRDPAASGFGLPADYFWFRRRGAGPTLARVPQFSLTRDEPNLALLFEVPLLLNFRRAVAGPGGPPTVHGALLRIDDVAAARRMFLDLQLLRPLTAEDLDVVACEI